MSKQAVAYYRVSTEKQGQSGLGLDAQRKLLHDFVDRNDYVLQVEYTEVESSTCNVRPVLAEALSLCKKRKAVLLIARLDRLARNVAFISTLLQSDVRFIAVDNPFADKFMTHIKAAFAELERELISTRTKQALEAAKIRGVELGKHGKYVLSKQNKLAAELFAKQMMPLVIELKEKGFKTIRKLCAELNRLKVPTFRGEGFKWHPQTVHSILERCKQNEFKQLQIKQ